MDAIDTTVSLDKTPEDVINVSRSNDSSVFSDISSLIFLALPESMTTLFLTAMLLSMLLWNQYLNGTRDRKNPLPLPPGFMGLPILGNTPFIVFEPLLGDVFEILTYLFGMVYKMHIVGQPVIRLGGPDLCSKVLNGDNTVPIWPYTVRTLMGDGANSQNTGTKHKAHRRVVMRAFTPQALTGYAASMQRGCREEILKWRDSTKPINVFTQSKVLAFKVAWELLVGTTQVEGTDDLTKSFMEFIDGFISLPFYAPGFSFYKACQAKEVIHYHIGKAMSKVRSQGVSRRNCAVDLILSNAEETDNMTDTDIKDLITELLFAGHETISSVFTSTVMHLTNHPECLTKLRKVLDEENLLTEDFNDDLTYEKVKSVQYAEDIFREIIRYTPPVQGVFRKVINTFDAEGYQVPSGWSVMAGIKETHRHNPFYEEPKTFNPDRWEKLRDQPANLRKHFLGFGAGAHMCVGKDYAKLMGIIFIIEIARLCDWSVKKPTPSCTYIPSYRPRDGFPTTFFHRSETEMKQKQ